MSVLKTKNGQGQHKKEGLVSTETLKFGRVFFKVQFSCEDLLKIGAGSHKKSKMLCQETAGMGLEFFHAFGQVTLESVILQRHNSQLYIPSFGKFPLQGIDRYLPYKEMY